MRKEIKIVVIGGASINTPVLVQNLIDQKEELKIKELWLLDMSTNEEKLKIIFDFSKQLIKTNQLDINMYQSVVQKEALKDADFVITQLRSNMHEQDIEDDKICYENNLYSNELFGVGSVFKALRAVPTFYEIIEDMNDLCEHAWMINITQPMGLISEAVIRYAEFDKYIGISHVTPNIISCFSNTLNTKPDNLILYGVGLSPITFITNVFQNKKDRFEDLIHRIIKQEDACYWSKELLKDLQAFPSIDLKHIYEQQDVLKEFRDQYETQKTKTLIYKNTEEKLYKLYQNNLGDEAIKLQRTIDDNQDIMKAIHIMSSMINDKRDYQIINTTNNNHINDLPEGSAIEISARITKDGPMPMHISRLPNQVKGLLQYIKSFEELIADAIYERNLDKASLALKVHPMMYDNSNITKSFESFIKSNKKQLTYYIKETYYNKSSQKV